MPVILRKGQKKTKMKDLILAHTFGLGITVIILSVAINLLLRYKWVKSTILKVIDDTLKVNDGPVRRFSGTKLTMWAAFASILFVFIYTSLREFNEYAFLVMALIATGVSLTGAWSKKINPPAETTQDTQKTEG